MPRAAALAATRGNAKAAVVYNSASAPVTRASRASSRSTPSRSRGWRCRGRGAPAVLFVEELWKAYTRPGILACACAFSVRRDKPLCLTSIKDMGAAAARSRSRAWPRSPLDVVSDVLTPAEIAAAFGAAQSGRCATAGPGSCTSSRARSCPSSTRSCGSTGRRTGGNAARRMSYSRRSRRRPSSTRRAFLAETRWADAGDTRPCLEYVNCMSVVLRQLCLQRFEDPCAAADAVTRQ